MKQMNKPQNKTVKVFMHKVVADLYAQEIKGEVGSLIKGEGWPVYNLIKQARKEK